jgi:RNA polymerase sigma factor (TIGR02999 family)
MATLGSDPSNEDPERLVKLLRLAAAGDKAARDRLVDELYEHMHRLARILMRNQPAGHTLQATGLVSECYLRLFRQRDQSWNDREHFLRCAALAMRRILIDHARRRKARPHESRRESAELDELQFEYEQRALDVEELSAALDRLAGFDPQMAQGIELRFFGGATAQEAALAVGLPERSFERRWQSARAWLFKELR